MTRSHLQCERGGMIDVKLTNQVLSHFGKKVKELRKKRNLSQEALADRSDLDRTYIGGVERGERNISLINIEKLATALDVDLKDFFVNE